MWMELEGRRRYIHKARKTNHAKGGNIHCGKTSKSLGGGVQQHKYTNILLNNNKPISYV